MPAQYKPRRKKFRFNRFTGGMNTVAESHSYNTVDPGATGGYAFTQIDFEWVNQDNWEIINRGGLSKDFGFSMFYDSPVLEPITGLYHFYKSNGTDYFIFGHQTNTYKLVAGVATAIVSGLSSGALQHYETAKDYLIVNDGVGAPYKWDGASVTLLGGSPPSFVRQALYTQNRLFLLSNDGYLYYSDADNIESGYAANFINLNRNDGQTPTGIAKLFIPGELRPLILVSKEQSMGIIDGDGSTEDPFVYKEIAPDLGVLGFRQMVVFEQDAAFLTPKGVSTYATAIKNVNIEQKFISQNIYNQFTALSDVTLPQALMWYDWKNDRIACAVATGANDYPDTIWFYNLRTAGWRKKTGFNTVAAFVDKDGTVYTGDDTGNIFVWESGTYNYDGDPIIATAQTPYMDFMEPDTFKQITYCEITLRAQGNYNLNIGNSLDDGLRSAQTNTVNMAAGLYVWGGSVWTSDPDVYQWGAAPIVRRKFYPLGIFKNRSFALSNTGADQPIDIIDWVIEVEYLDQH